MLEKPSIQGKRFMSGEVLYQIADLSSVWVLADVFEQELGMLRLGQPAAVRVDAYPDKVFNGKVTFIYPTVTPETRTAKVRVELANPQALLKPAMYAKVEFASGDGRGKVLAVPDSAVLDSGTRQVVLVELGAGRFEPRVVKLGIARRRLRRSAGRGESRRGGGRQRELPDRRGEQSQGGARRLRPGHPGRQAGGEGPAKPGASAAAAGPVTHRGEGSVEAVDAAARHRDARPWPDRQPQVAGDVDGFPRQGSGPDAARLKPGQKIDFEFVDAGGGEYLIVRAQPAAGGHGEH